MGAAMPGQKSKLLEDILAAAAMEQERYARQQQRARQLVEQAQRALRDSNWLHQWHVGRDRKRLVPSR